MVITQPSGRLIDADQVALAAGVKSSSLVTVNAGAGVCTANLVPFFKGLAAAFLLGLVIGMPAVSARCLKVFRSNRRARQILVMV
jgi:hypothetical protein